MKSVFHPHGNDSGLNDRSGQMVEVLHLLTSKEADLNETGPMYRVRFDDGTETDAFLDEIPDVMEIRICEAVYDITTVVCDILHRNRSTAEFVDLDSRDVFSDVYDWAREFENEHPCPKDYMTEIEEFAYEKFREYLAHFDLQEAAEKKIHTHDEAASIVELFEDVLDQNGISVPSPEDDEREPDNDAKLYGSVYADLLDAVEEKLSGLLLRHTPHTDVVENEFSGSF